LIFGAFDFCMNSFGEAVSCCLVTVISLTEGLSVFFLAASAAETNQKHGQCRANQQASEWRIGSSSIDRRPRDEP